MLNRYVYLVSCVYRPTSEGDSAIDSESCCNYRSFVDFKQAKYYLKHKRHVLNRFWSCKLYICSPISEIELKGDIL